MRDDEEEEIRFKTQIQSKTQAISSKNRFTTQILIITIPIKRAAITAVTPRRKKPKDIILEVFGDIKSTLKTVMVKDTPLTAPSAKTLALRTLQSIYPNLNDDEFVKAVDIVDASIETFNILSGKRRDAWL